MGLFDSTPSLPKETKKPAAKKTWSGNNNYSNYKKDHIETKELFLKAFVKNLSDEIILRDVWSKKELIELLTKNLKSVILPY